MSNLSAAREVYSPSPALAPVRPLFEVTVYLSEDTDVYNCSMILSGLCQLERQKLIRLRFTAPSRLERPHFSALCGLCAEVSGMRDAGQRRIVFDLFDSSARLSRPLLESCDVYFKRSLFRPDLDGLPGTLKAKIRPFGLNCPCASAECVFRVLRVLAPGLARAALRPLLGGPLGELRRIVHGGHAFLFSPELARLEQDPHAPLDPTLVFQTRVWENGETASDDTQDFNAGRVAVLRALRAAFPALVRGGLVPTPCARREYPDLVTVEPARRGRYLRMARRNLIGVYTRGIEHSLAFKLTEYLAASQCVVAEPLRIELPAPLLEGVNYLSFRTPAECVAACRRLLSDAALAARMRQANFEYYDKWLRPPAPVLRCLREAF